MALIDWKQLRGVPATATSRRVVERLTIATANTIPNLTFTPRSNAEVILHINGVSNSSTENPAPFTVAAKVITWNPANAHALATTDMVIADYLTSDP